MYIGLHQKRSYDKSSVSLEDNSTNSTGVEKDPTHVNRFREMCEEQPAVKALRYLQTEVSEVVDHTDPEETSVFQSLLAHLLSLRVVISAGDASTPSKEVARREEPSETRPRANTPEEVWTNMIDGEEDDTQHTPPGSIPLTCPSTPGERCRAVLQMDEDLVETRMREERKAVSAEQFSQRTETLERLLGFVGEGGKQPKGPFTVRSSCVTHWVGRRG